MNQTSPANSSSHKSELGLLIGILFGLAIIVSFFYWLGSGDRAFAQRKTEILLDQLTRVTDSREDQTGMELFVSYAKEADTTGHLLQGQLEPDIWLRIAQQRAVAICMLVSMGDLTRSADLNSLCAKLKTSGDPRAREIGSAAQCALEFEQQYVLCKHRMIVAEIIDAASTEENGEAGQRIANRIREQQKSDWRLATIARELMDLSKSLPAGNSLSPRFPRYVSQLIDIEESIERGTTIPTYEDWVRQTQSLVAQYPNNGMICRSVVDEYDRLNHLQCYGEAEQLLAAVLDQYGNQPSTGNLEVFGELEDRRSASQIDLNRWKASVQSTPETSADVAEKMIEGARELQANQRFSPGIVERYIEVVEEMEKSQQYEAISKIRNELTSIVVPNREAAERFQSYCAASMRRAALVGKPFVLPGGLTSNNAVDPEVFKDHATAVVFWGADAASFEMLHQLEQLFRQHKNAGFGMIAINVDSNLDMVREMMAQQAPEWTVVVASGIDATGRNPLAVEYGIHRAPYLILVDSAGQVADVALSVHDMWDRATVIRPSLKTVSVPRERGPAGR